MSKYNHSKKDLFNSFQPYSMKTNTSSYKKLLYRSNDLQTMTTDHNEIGIQTHLNAASHDSYIDDKLQKLDRILGKSKDSQHIKKGFVSMLINSQFDLVPKRNLGKCFMSMELRDTIAVHQAREKRNYSQILEEQKRVYERTKEYHKSYLATNGGASANEDPIKKIEILIKHQKPDIITATQPSPYYKAQIRFHPKHMKKLHSIEDIITQQQNLQIASAFSSPKLSQNPSIGILKQTSSSNAVKLQESGIQIIGNEQVITSSSPQEQRNSTSFP